MAVRVQFIKSSANCYESCKGDQQNRVHVEHDPDEITLARDLAGSHSSQERTSLSSNSFGRDVFGPGWDNSLDGSATTHGRPFGHGNIPFVVLILGRCAVSGNGHLNKILVDVRCAVTVPAALDQKDDSAGHERLLGPGEHLVDQLPLHAVAFACAGLLLVDKLVEIGLAP